MDKGKETGAERGIGKRRWKYDTYLPSSKLNLAQANDRRHPQTKRAHFVKTCGIPRAPQIGCGVQTRATVDYTD